MSFKSGDTKPETYGTTTQISKVSAEELQEVRTLLNDEKSHLKQWRKHLLAIAIIVISLVVNFLRGSRKTPSIIGISKCGTLDWTIFTFFVVIAFLLSYVGVVINKRE